MQMRRLLRVTGLAALLVLLTASQCLTQSSDIQYAAGYGYVVPLLCKGCRYDRYYVTFDTYQQAQTWLNNWRDRFDYYGNSNGRPNLPPGYATYYDDGDKEYKAITALLGPPNLHSTGAVDLNQPQPFVPQ
ncbi:hypothetical protein [Dongia sedimenti]|uniref:Secreted protein n=1 Tax=Dongia sedimenti TaxID=3064282 RepID=A0ABU0YV79_9PROT|nr:hypothetical protein [Rhodospirillaceae bacterium R-7]